MVISATIGFTAGSSITVPLFSKAAPVERRKGRAVRKQQAFAYEQRLQTRHSARHLGSRRSRSSESDLILNGIIQPENDCMKSLPDR